MRAHAAALAAFVLAACSRAPEPVAETALAAADTVVSAGSGWIGGPTDVAVDERGRVYVLDAMYSRVLVVPGGGAEPFTVGRRGSGPGELRGPIAVSAGADTVRVADRENGHVEALTLDGREGRRVRIPGEAQGGDAALTPSGAGAFATYGIHGPALARLMGADGRAGGGIGRRAEGGGAMWDFTALKAEIARGRVPGQMRNRVKPLLGADGGAWLVLLADPAVQRFAPDGRLLWTAPLHAPEIEAIRREFFRANEAQSSPSVLVPLSYVADAAEAGGWVWLLLEGGSSGPAVLLVVSPEGAVARRVTVPGAEGARRIAVEAERGRLYLALASADLVSAPLPPDLVPGGVRRDGRIVQRPASP